MKKILSEIKQINKKVIKIINYGFTFCFAVSIIGLLLMLTYNTYSVSYDFFKAGIILIRTSILFAAQFVACGFIMDRLKKGKI